MLLFPVVFSVAIPDAVASMCASLPFESDAGSPVLGIPTRQRVQTLGIFV